MERSARARLRQRHRLEALGKVAPDRHGDARHFERALKRYVNDGYEAPAGLSALLIGARGVGEALVDHDKVALVSATGSTAMGRAVGPKLAARFARSILELGGNNAAIVAPTAESRPDPARRRLSPPWARPGQRCTTLRRLFVHDSVYDTLVPRLKPPTPRVKVGKPMEDGTLVGPLIDCRRLRRLLKRPWPKPRRAGGTVTGGERVDVAEGAFYVRPAIVE